MERENKKTSLLRAVILVIAACLIYGIMQGIHDNYGIMMKALVPYTGISYQQISFVIGVGAFLYGLVQPFFGMLALRKSNTLIMLIGIVMILIGMFATPLCRHFWSMLLFFGIVLPSGTGALAFGIVMSAITPLIGEKRSAAASGVVQASAGIGDALMSPALQFLISWRGITFSMGSFPFALIATGCLGATGDSTVPPTTGLITKEFGARKMAVYYGIALVGHQVGAFLSSSFGGICAEQFGTYQPLWAVNAVLCTIAAISSYSIMQTMEEEH